jgi:CheY-like chemotaxis protein
MKDYAGNQCLVLVIEEKQEVLQQVTSALASGNYSSCCCTTGKSALAAVEESRPDLIISATSLNGESGQALCERIKQCEGLATVPVMYLCGGQIPDIIRRHDQMGGSYYVRKPFDSEVLLELAGKAMQTPMMAGN